MNTLKTGLFALTALAGFAANAQEKEVTLTDLPQKAQALIQTHFSDLTLATITCDAGFLKKEYEVEFTNGTEIDFKGSGKWKEIEVKEGALPAALFPAEISEYVLANYPTATIQKIEREGCGYEIELADKTEIDFNGKGKFKKIDE